MDGVLTFQNGADHRAGAHIVGQAVKKRTFPVYGVKPFRLCLGHVDHLEGHDLKASPLDHGKDFAGQIPLYGIGFDQGKGTLNHACSLLWVKKGDPVHVFPA